MKAVPETTRQLKPGLRYVRLAEQLRQQIESGDLKPGDRLPSHAESRERHGVTQSTLERAHAVLEQEGLIERLHRRGTFVCDGRQAEAPPIVMADERTVVVIAGPHGFFDSCVRPLFGQMQAADLTLVCRVLDADLGASLRPPPLGQRPLGFLVFDYHLAGLALRLHQSGCRVVLMGAPPPDETPEVPCVFPDHEHGGFLAASHLLGLGHRNIAFTGGSDFEQTLRWRGHQRAIREAQRSGSIGTTFLPDADLSAWQQEPAQAAAYFSRPGAPSAVAVWNDYEALRLLGVLSRANVSVPGQVSVLGYDNLPQGEMMHPSLSTIDHAIDQQLRAALSLLTRPLAPPPSHTVMVTPSLLQRASSGASPQVLRP